MVCEVFITNGWRIFVDEIQMGCKGMSYSTYCDGNFLPSSEAVRGDPIFCVFVNNFKFVGGRNGIPIVLPYRVYFVFDG